MSDAANEYERWTEDLLLGRPARATSRVEERYHAPSPPMSPTLKGHVHLHVLQPLKQGRYQRAVGECLCGKKRGSNEQAPSGGQYRCERCAVVARRFGIEWPSAILARKQIGGMKI